MESGLVFTEPDGTPLHPADVTELFQFLVRQAGPPPIRLHDLRHGTGDNRTIGYTTAEITPATATVGTVQVHAKDIENRDTDLNADGRTGYGALRREQPPSTVLFTFSEGQPIHVTDTIPDDPNSVSLMSFDDENSPRYACLGGIDAFDRVHEQQLTDGSPGSRQCAAAFAPPD